MFKKLWVRIQAPYSGWTFSHRFVVKIVVCLKRPKINEKEAGDGPFLQKMLQLIPNRTLTSRNPM